eukprot:5083579-Amphidinium_carterae.1
MPSFEVTVPAQLLCKVEPCEGHMQVSWKGRMGRSSLSCSTQSTTRILTSLPDSRIVPTE